MSKDDHVVAGVLQRLHQEPAHVVVVFGEQDYLSPWPVQPSLGVVSYPVAQPSFPGDP